MTDKLDPKIEAVVGQCEAAISETLSAMPHVSHFLAAEIVEHFKAALTEAGAVVPVTCGECRHANTGGSYMTCGSEGIACGAWVRSDWSCADGERAAAG